MASFFMGEISMFGGNFAPRTWAFCDGTLLPISQNTALFSILGTTYGGDGRTTFGLPDLRGRGPIGQGNGPGLTPRTLGQKSGQEQVTLTTAQMPPHIHGVFAEQAFADKSNPTDKRMSYHNGYVDESAAENRALHTKSIKSTGGGQPHNNMHPYQAINYIISLQGTYPSRS